MNIDDVLEKLVELIDIKQRELEKMNAAYDVIYAMRWATPPPPPKAEPKAGAKFVVSKPVPAFKEPAAAKARGSYAPRTKKTMTERKKARTDIALMLRDSVELRTFDIIQMLFGDHPTLQERKRVWNALTAMVKHGEAVRVDVGVYRRPEAGHEKATGGSEELRVQVPA